MPAGIVKDNGRRRSCGCRFSGFNEYVGIDAGTPDFLTTLEGGFREFFEKEVSGNPLKAEYLIPIFIGELLKQEKMSVKVLKTDDTWYGDLLTSDKNVQLEKNCTQPNG